MMMVGVNVDATSIDGANRDQPSNDVLQGEAVLFHEYGHMLADRLGIASRNESINELIANIFASSYIKSERPDLYSQFELRRASPGMVPRYTR